MIAINLAPDTRGMWGQELADLIIAAPAVVSCFKGGATAWEKAKQMGAIPVKDTRTHIVGERQFTYGVIVFQTKELAAAVVKTMQAADNPTSPHPIPTHTNSPLPIPPHPISSSTIPSQPTAPHLLLTHSNPTPTTHHIPSTTLELMLYHLTSTLPDPTHPKPTHPTPTRPPIRTQANPCHSIPFHLNPFHPTIPSHLPPTHPNPTHPSLPCCTSTHTGTEGQRRHP